MPDSITHLFAQRYLDASPDARRLYLRLASDDEREEVYRILMRCPGNIKVVLAIGPEKRRMDLKRHLWVSDEVDLAALEKLLSKDSVILKKPVRQA